MGQLDLLMLVRFAKFPAHVLPNNRVALALIFKDSSHFVQLNARGKIDARPDRTQAINNQVAIDLVARDISKASALHLRVEHAHLERVPPLAAAVFLVKSGLTRVNSLVLRSRQ